MARPLIPLISRPAAVATSIDIIDTEGMASFSLSRVAKEMKVSTSSLYHHFSDRDELLTEVVKKIMVGATMPPPPEDGNWQAWFVELSLNYRDAVLRHSNAAPLVVQYLPRDLLTDIYEKCAAVLESCGVPDELHVIILDGLEKLSFATIFTGLTHRSMQDSRMFPNADSERHPVLTKAIAANTWSARDLFQVTIRSFLDGVVHGADVTTAWNAGSPRH